MYPTLLLSAFLALPMLAVADTPYTDDQVFITDENELQLAKDSVPLFYFSAGSCYAEAAEDGNFGQTEGAKSPDCTADPKKLSKGCTHDTTFQYFNAPGPTVPVYYGMKFCNNFGDVTIRLFYDLYFKQDIGHESDWEWAAVILRKRDDGLWWRDELWMEQDGKVEAKKWSELDTFAGDNDKLVDGQRNFNHPRLYVEKYHHAIHAEKSTSSKSICTSAFRNIDFYMWDSSFQNLRSFARLDQNWNWGQAKSNPRGLMGQGRDADQDICNKAPSKPQCRVGKDGNC